MFSSAGKTLYLKGLQGGRMLPIKNLCSAILSREDQVRIDALKKHFSEENLQSLTVWLSANVKEIDPPFVCALAHVIDDLIFQTHVVSTQQLFFLASLITNLLSQAFGHEVGEFERLVLVQLLKNVTENGVGPSLSTPRDAADIYKRVFNYRGCCLAERGEYVASIEHFNVTLSLDPYFAPAYCNRARAHLELNHLEDAWKDCRAMHSFDPNYPVGQATSQLVETLHRLKQRRKGTLAEIAQAQDLLKLLRRYDRPLKPQEQRLRAGEQVNPLEMPAELGPHATADALNHLGVVRGRRGDYKGAIEAFSRALQREPGYLKAYYNRAKAYVLLDEYEKAIADFTAIVEQNPQETEARRYLAEAQEKWRHKQEAQGEAPDTSRQGDRDEEEHDIQDEGITSIFKRADYLSRFQRNPQQALALLSQLAPEPLQVYATLPAQIRLQQAAIVERQGQLEDAVRYYSEALEMLSGTQSKARLLACLEGLARSLQAQGQTTEALAHLHQALSISRETGNDVTEERLYHRLGQVEETNLHLHQAQDWYRKAEELARKRENWGGIFAALSRLASLAPRLGHPEEQQRLEAQCRQLYEELGEIVYAGPTALMRPQVAAQAQELLGLEDTQSLDPEMLKRWYDEAQELRKNQKKHKEAIPLYRAALSGYIQLSQLEGVLGCLIGLGAAYEKLSEEVFAQARRQVIQGLDETAHAADQQSVLGLFVGNSIQIYDVLYTEVDELAGKARACHRWALELYKELDDLASQANQISNIANTEEQLGNLDTARRYQSWALQTHLQLGEPEEAAIDLLNLAHIEESLGDQEAADAMRKRARELRNAT
jgi:tetratricopeptide (TPR) repeat protein